jgi:hypothetical protein
VEQIEHLVAKEEKRIAARAAAIGGNKGDPTGAPPAPAGESTSSILAPAAASDAGTKSARKKRGTDGQTVVDLEDDGKQISFSKLDFEYMMWGYSQKSLLAGARSLVYFALLLSCFDKCQSSLTCQRLGLFPSVTCI